MVQVGLRVSLEHFRIGGISGSSTACWSMAPPSWPVCSPIRHDLCNGDWCSGMHWSWWPAYWVSLSITHGIDVVCGGGFCPGLWSIKNAESHFFDNSFYAH